MPDQHRPTAPGNAGDPGDPGPFNLPCEEWLLALCNKGFEACQAVLEAHDDCCDVCTDAAGLKFNLDMGRSSIYCQLFSSDDDQRAALERSIDLRIHLAPGRNLPEEDSLLRVLGLLLAGCDAVLNEHDDAAEGGNCQCNLCFDVRGLRYNVNQANDLIGCQLLGIDPPEKVLEQLIEIRARSRAKDGPGCRCEMCSVLDETLRGVAQSMGLTATPVEPEADAADAPAVVGTAGEAPGAIEVVTPTPPPAVVPPRQALRQRRNYWEPSDN